MYLVHKTYHKSKWKGRDKMEFNKTIAARQSVRKFTEAQITDEQFDALEQARQNFENSLKSDDVKEIAQADVAFHDAIYNATGNAKLVSMLNNLREQMYRYRVEYLKDETIYPRLLKEHKDIAESLRRKDKSRASETMREHVKNQAEAVKDMIRQQEQDQ